MTPRSDPRNTALESAFRRPPRVPSLVERLGRGVRETWLVLDSTDSITDRNDNGFRDGFPGHVAFGGNGGLETFALHYPGGEYPESVVAIDRNSTSAEDAWHIAPSVTDALARLLRQPSGPWNAD